MNASTSAAFEKQPFPLPMKLTRGGASADCSTSTMISAWVPTANRGWRISMTPSRSTVTCSRIAWVMAAPSIYPWLYKRSRPPVTSPLLQRLPVEPLLHHPQGVLPDLVPHLELAVGEGDAVGAQGLARFSGLLHVDPVVPGAVDDQHRKALLLRHLRQDRGKLRRKPGREGRETREARRLAQRELIAHHAALAEAGHHHLLEIDGIALQRLVDEFP